MRARDRMRQEADLRHIQELVAGVLGERPGPGAPLFIRDEMANGWHPVELIRAMTPHSERDQYRVWQGGSLRQSYRTPGLIVDEAGRGVLSVADFRKQIFEDAADTMDRNEVYVRPDPDPAPALSPDFWDKLLGGEIVDLDGAPHPVDLCPDCRGSGYSCNGAESWPCPTCSGDGSAEATPLSLDVDTRIQYACPDCGGSGYWSALDGSDYGTCYACNGDGSAEAPLFDMEPPKQQEKTDD